MSVLAIVLWNDGYACPMEVRTCSIPRPGREGKEETKIRRIRIRRRRRRRRRLCTGISRMLPPCVCNCSPARPTTASLRYSQQLRRPVRILEPNINNPCESGGPIIQPGSGGSARNSKERARKTDRQTDRQQSNGRCDV